MIRDVRVATSNGEGDDDEHTLQCPDQGWTCMGMTLVVTDERGNENARDFVPGQ